MVWMLKIACNLTGALHFSRLKALGISYRMVQSTTCVELTSERYPEIKRKGYSKLTSDDILAFKNMLGKEGIIMSYFDLESHNTDWLRTCRGQSTLLLRPKNTDEMSKVMTYCHHRNLAVCPQGGNTGLVGGSVPVFDEIILSTSRMKEIIDFDEHTGVIVCQAGCVLEALENYVDERNHIIPLDLGAKGSCHIGGNVSTNAGGLRLIRYGSLQGSVLGVEVVLSNGQIVDCLSSLRKDNTGYNLKQLFIGSEGTLGVVTKVSVLCPPKPAATAVAFLGCLSFDNVLTLFKTSRQMLLEIVSSFEMMDHYSLEVLQYVNVRIPISDCPFYVLVEVAGSNSEHNEEKLSAWIKYIMEKGLVIDGTMATEPSHVKNIWAVRERVSEALLHEGYVYKYDISLPLKEYYSIVEIMRERLGSSVKRCCGYGHIGDGNVHLNMTSPIYSPEILHRIEPFIYDWIAKHKGSISAEHGLGFKKRDYIGYSKSVNAVNLMRKLKATLDPKGILNPYKVLPDI